ncbi:MAG: Riboflavin biosynthesis protein RibF [Myxococcota bacterium]|nr:Riboflavin biosynthesis protein RibF [Myxococcota bacterium]
MMAVEVSSIAGLRNRVERAVVTIGNFDGVHRGHRFLIERVIRRAEELRAEPAAVTFIPHPLEILAAERKPQLITTYAERRRLLEETGIAHVIEEPFTLELADTSAKDFVLHFLRGRLNAVEVWVGHDFRFGKGRQGDFDLLARMGDTLGFEARRIEAFSLADGVVSSTRIREAVRQGRVREAGRLLGRAYSLDGPVVHGAGRGRKLGIPTANVAVRNELLPKFGVYAAFLVMEGQRFPGALNVGRNPMFENKGVHVEIHLFDFDRNIYGREVRLELVEYLREEAAYSSLDILLAQIDLDISQSREILANPSATAWDTD